MNRITAQQVANALACHECDALFRLGPGRRGILRCARCGAALQRPTLKPIDESAALTLAASVSFAIANSFPIVAIEAAGNRVDATLVGSAFALYRQNMAIVAIVVLLTTIVFPVMELVCANYLLLSACASRGSEWITPAFRLREAIRPWNMVEIFVLGALVALVKLGGLAHVIPGIGLWSLAAFIVLSAAAAYSFDPLQFWVRFPNRERIDHG